jgi:hypothetical protein
MNPTKSISASFYPAGAWPTRVLHTDTNSARRPVAAGVFSGAVLSAGRDISGERSNDRALPSRTARARSFFSRWRNADVARVLTGTELNAVRPSTMRTGDVTGFRLQLPPQPAHFFVEPRPGYVLTTQPRRNHSNNARGLRLAWLLGINGGLQ